MLTYKQQGTFSISAVRILWLIILSYRLTRQMGLISGELMQMVRKIWLEGFTMYSVWNTVIALRFHLRIWIGWSEISQIFARSFTRGRWGKPNGFLLSVYRWTWLITRTLIKMENTIVCWVNIQVVWGCLIILAMKICKARWNSVTRTKHLTSTQLKRKRAKKTKKTKQSQRPLKFLKNLGTN